MKYTILEGKLPVRSTLLEWARWMEKNQIQIRVALDKIDSPDLIPATISTVFLGLNHGWGDIPKWFETGIFYGNGSCEIIDRYTSWEEAEDGHRRVTEAVKNHEI